MDIQRKIMKKTLIIAALADLLALSAHADIIPTLTSVSPSGSNFTWSYNANVTGDEKVTTGDFFTIYDFGSIISVTNTQPAGWTFSSQNLGITPPSLVGAAGLTDNGAVLNLSWAYSGPTIIGPQALGVFSVQTTVNSTRISQFTAEATRSTGPEVGSKIDNIGEVTVPVPEMSALTPMLAICGLTIVGLMTSRWHRRTS
ncbi:MAG: hypothetical protein H0U99_04355 [Chthoniobacterales bacterium]|nr:hypothetical protein [Chthoniobacterales bacterium]